MKVRELIRMLSKFPEDAEVRAWDPDAEDWMAVTGAIYGDDASTPVDLYTDEDRVFGTDAED